MAHTSTQKRTQADSLSETAGHDQNELEILSCSRWQLEDRNASCPWILYNVRAHMHMWVPPQDPGNAIQGAMLDGM